MIFGIDRLVNDLQEIGFTNIETASDGNFKYVMIKNFNIPAGSFISRNIDLAIPVSADYPRSGISSMHIRANPHLVDFGHIGTRNVTTSTLGSDWQYWSYSFHIRPTNPTSELMTQINEIFRKN